MLSQTQVKIAEKPNNIKCVVWDLDNTLWDGVLLENDAVRLREPVVDVIKQLDGRGILHSIASRNDPTLALAKLRQFDLEEYFLYPQINWNPKSESVKAIAKRLNIGTNTLAFVDDQPFEREEVSFVLPELLTIDAADVQHIPNMPAMTPRFVTDDAWQRRLMYRSDIQRDEAERAFADTSERFLATLGMVFRIARAQESDLQRAEELTVRTNQLNSTGYTYSYEELRGLAQSSDHLLLIASLDDRFGLYGKIGLALVECRPDCWTLKLLLMSCRVMSRGVGTLLLNDILRRAKASGVRFRAEFVTTDRNRMMYITYKFGGFLEVSSQDNHILFEHDLINIAPVPAYVDLRID